LSWTKQIDHFSQSFNEELRLKGKDFLQSLEEQDQLRTGMTNLSVLLSLLPAAVNPYNLFSEKSLERSVLEYH